MNHSSTSSQSSSDRLIPAHRSLPLAILILLVVGSCAGFNRTMPAYPRPVVAPAADSAELSAAVDRFYRAPDFAAAVEAVNTATRIAPDSARTHEIAGRLAWLAGDEAGAWQHYYLALATPENPAAYLHLLALFRLPMTTSQYRETAALFQDILDQHPDEALKRVVAGYLSDFKRRLDRDARGASAVQKTRGLLEHFSIIAAFDNQGGRGYAAQYAPERELDFSQTYQGAQSEASWRVDVPLDYRKNLNLGNLISPSAWVTGYAVTFVEVPREGLYQLRITTTDPIKAWVNDTEILAEQRITDHTIDQFVIPVVLRRGWNKLLLKSCHGRGVWRVAVALTGEHGERLKGINNTAQLQTVAPGPAPGPRYTLEADLKRRLADIPEPARRLFYSSLLAETFGLLNDAQDRADAYRSEVSRGLLSRLQSALIAWDAGRLGHTIDMLDTLIAENPTAAPRLLLFRSMYFKQQARRSRMRVDLQRAVEMAPNFREARHQLAKTYGDEGWHEDHLAARLEDVNQWPDDTRIQWGLANAYTKLGRLPRAEAVYQRILELWPGDRDILKKMSTLALKRGDEAQAVAYQQTICELYINMPTCYLNLGDLLRRTNRPDEAIRAYERCRAIDEQWATPLNRLAELAYESGDVDGAIELWKQSRDLDPDNHSLADRLEYLVEEETSLLEEFAPDKSTIQRIVAQRHEVVADESSNMVMLYDHAVEQIGPDGSSRQIVTQIFTAANDTGRDQLTRYSLPPGRRSIIEAFAIDPDGIRREASSVRGNELRFRELKVGSTVVIQFRLDIYPAGYLSRYLHRRWLFHAIGTQFEHSQFVLIMPRQLKIHETGSGDWKRSESLRGDQRIITYLARQNPPFVIEPHAPPIVDLLDRVTLSTVPEWDTIAKWDAALLADAFRSSPEIKALTESLTEDATTPLEQLNALTRYVMREIRYQQDYETSIAGVKPHAAPIVVQRKYGDCKDKSVLLMTMARELGIETHFALVRTTGIGALDREMPSLQFNHAIVYVPSQSGIKKPFFIDATPDTLDLGVLRPDVQDTWAMVIDPTSEEWSFVHIPFSPPSDQYTLRRTYIEPVLDDKSKAMVTVTARGPSASAIRQILRNSEDTKIFASQLITNMFPGSQITEIDFSGEKDIVEPLTLRLAVSSDRIWRRQGDDLIVSLPKTQELTKFTALAQRRLPLKTGHYLALIETEDEIAIPDGYVPKHLPTEIDADTPFFSFRRTFEQTGKAVKCRIRFVDKKKTISQEEYPDYRTAVTRIVRDLEADLVFAPASKARRRPSKR